MNIAHKSFAAMTAIALSLGFALPAAALDVYGSANSQTQGTVTAGGSGAGANGSAGLDANVGVGGSASSSSSGGSTSGSASGAASGEASVDVAPLIITRIDIDSGAVKATVSSPASVHSQADLSGYVASEMTSDSNIAAVESASDSVAVTYKQHAKLFGFIPVTVDATATVDAEGNVDVDYPWYAFLMVTNRGSLEAKIQDRVDATLSASASASANAAVDASAAANAAAELTAQEQARVVAEVRAVLESELNASASADASAAANANVQ